MKIYRALSFIIIASVLTAGPLYAGYYEQGRSFYVYKKYDKAKEMFLKVVEQHPHGDSYYFLGEIEKLQGNFSEAEKYFSEAIATRGTTGKYLKNAYWNLIVLAEQKGDYDNVVKTCKRMWDHLKDDGARQKIESLINKSLWTDNQEAIDLYKKGIDKKERGDMEAALSLFHESMRTDSSFLAPRFEIAMAAYKKGQTGDAASYLREITSRIPYYAEAHLVLGDIYYQNHSYSSAITHFSRALEFGFISSSTEYLISLKMAECYYNESEYEKAVEQAERARSLDKKAIKPLILLAAIQIKQQNLDGALKTLHEANRLDGNNPLVLFQIGSIYYKQDDSHYLSYFDKLFDGIKQDTTEIGRYNRAIIILVNGHFEKKNYQRVIDIIRSLPENLVSYDISLIHAKALFNMRQYDEAIDIFEKLSLNNDNKFILCQAYSRSGRKDQAVDLLKSLMYYDQYRGLAEKDANLVRLLREIERQKNAEEEEQRKNREIKLNQGKDGISETDKGSPIDNRDTHPDRTDVPGGLN